MVTVEDDTSAAVNTVWSLDNDDASIINDISAGDIQWAVQSRPADATTWSIKLFEDKVRIFRITGKYVDER